MPDPSIETIRESRAACLENWPGAHVFGYDPACCRFPKSCSIEDDPDAAMTDQTSETTPDGLDVAAVEDLLLQRNALEDYVETLGDLNGELAARLGEARIALAAAESARDAAEGVVREVRALAEKWEGYAEACRLGMNNSAGETSEPKMLWSVAADRLFDALGDHAAPVTTDATEGGGASCDGSFICSAPLHIHGCYADGDGSACDDPDDHPTDATEGEE